MKAHHITLTAIAKEGEESELVETVKSLLPEDVEVSSETLEPETDGEVFNHALTKVSAKITKQKHIREFTKRLFNGLDDYDRRKLLESPQEFVDDDCTFYVRLSKDEASHGEYVFEKADSIHVAYKIAAFPAKKENAVKVVKELIDDGIR